MASQPVVLNNRYRVERKLGKGAMGEVFLATDLKEEEPVAIKTITQDLYNNKEIRERFTREVTAMRKLDHPHVISYIDAFTVKGRACLVMEYVGGGTLSEVITDRGQLDLGFFKKTAINIVEAVATAHDAGIIHRDLKPANILMNAILEPKVADFGLAKLSDLTTMTATGTAMGTLAYMPPEAFDMLAKVDERGDIWALGVIFFEMLTATLPFPAKTQPQMIGAILNDEPFSVTMYRRDVPYSWQMMIEQCLQKSPDARFQNARDMLNDLHEVPRARQEAQREGFVVDEDEDLFDFEMPPDHKSIVINIDRDDAIVPKQGPIAAAPHMQHVAAPDFAAKGRKAPSMSAMLFGTLLLWAGVAASMVGSALIVYSFTDSGEDFLQSIETAQALVLVGSVLFMGGLGVEAVLIRPERAMELFILLGGVGGIWLVFFSELALTGFLPSMLGIVFYTVAVVLYFQTQRT